MNWKLNVVLLFFVIGPLWEHVARLFNSKIKPSNVFRWISSKCIKGFIHFGKGIAWVSYWIYFGTWRTIRHVIKEWIPLIFEYIQKFIDFLRIDEFFISLYYYFLYPLRIVLSPLYMFYGYVKYIVYWAQSIEFIGYDLLLYCCGTITIIAILYSIIYNRNKIIDWVKKELKGINNVEEEKREEEEGGEKEKVEEDVKEKREEDEKEKEENVKK